MDAAEAVLAVLAPIGAAALALGKVILSRHLRVLDRIEETQRDTAKIQGEQLTELKRLADGLEDLKDELADRRMSEFTASVQDLKRQGTNPNISLAGLGALDGEGGEGGERPSGQSGLRPAAGSHAGGAPVAVGEGAPRRARHREPSRH